MKNNQFNNIVWCDLEIIVLKIHSYLQWDTKMINTCQISSTSKPIVNIYICSENNSIFDNPETYRENIMNRGLYRGHHFGLPARFKYIDDSNIAISHHDPGKILWCYVVKFLLTIYASKMNMLHIKSGAVAYKGKAFLVLGRGGSGKTEVIKELCKNGAKFMANTHVLIDKNIAAGVKSNIRVRRNGGDVYVPVNKQKNDDSYDGWLPIGGVLWVNYRTDGVSIIKSIPSGYAIPNIQFFTESIINWEMKEDIADYFNSNPFEFAKYINSTNELLKNFCENNSIYYLNLDIFSTDGMQKTIDVIENCLNMIF